MYSFVDFPPYIVYIVREGNEERTKGLTMETAKMNLIFFILGYVEFIASTKAYTVLTVCSEILNLFRVIPVCLICKVVVDMHREAMKIIIFTK